MNRLQDKTPEERQAIVAKRLATRRARREAEAAREQERYKYSGELGAKIADQERHLALLKSTVVISGTNCELDGTRLLRPEEISFGASDWGTTCGVYFLLQDSEVVYVGQSVNIYSRIASHTDKQFNRFAYVLCRKEHLDRLESLYIHCLQPKLNGGRGNAKIAPLPLSYLLGIYKQR